MYSGWLFSSRPVELSCVIVASHWTVLTTLLNIFSVLSLCLLGDWTVPWVTSTNRGRLRELCVNQLVSVIPGASGLVKVSVPCPLPPASIPGWPWYYAH